MIERGRMDIRSSREEVASRSLNCDDEKGENAALFLAANPRASRCNQSLRNRIPRQQLPDLSIWATSSCQSRLLKQNLEAIEKNRQVNDKQNGRAWFIELVVRQYPADVWARQERPLSSRPSEVLDCRCFSHLHPWWSATSQKERSCKLLQQIMYKAEGAEESWLIICYSFDDPQEPISRLLFIWQ